MAFVSIIIPTYNRERFVGRAIESALDQSYKDFEIIVTDDGSTDKTKEVVKAYGRSVKYIFQENRGAASARNAGIQASSGEYISFLDSDDYYEKDNLKKKVQILERNSKIGWVYSDWQYVDDRGNNLESGSDRFNYPSKKLSGKIFEELLYKRNFIATDTVMVRKSVLSDTGYFDPTIPSQEEYELWLRMSAKYPVYYLNEKLVKVALHSDSLSKDFSKWVYGNALIVDKIEKIIPNDVKVKKKFIKRLHADKYTFLGRDFLHNKKYRKAMISFGKSIKKFPFQKRIYWLILLLVLNYIKAYMRLNSITHEC